MRFLFGFTSRPIIRSGQDSQAKSKSRNRYLPLRPIISNIGTATYDLAKYLAKLLSPLSKSSYTVSSIDELVNILKNESSTLL